MKEIMNYFGGLWARCFDVKGGVLSPVFSKERFGRFVPVAVLIGTIALCHLSVSANPRSPILPHPEDTLIKLRFDGIDANGALHPIPSTQLNIGLVESWSGYALSMTGNVTRLLQYPIVGSGAKTNLNPFTGSVRFWYQPNWRSVSAGGNGPGATAIMFQAGDCASSNAISWSINVASNGNTLRLSVEAGGEAIG